MSDTWITEIEGDYKGQHYQIGWYSQLAGIRWRIGGPYHFGDHTRYVESVGAFYAQITPFHPNGTVEKAVEYAHQAVKTYIDEHLI
jgi:hypothetical protein